MIRISVSLECQTLGVAQSISLSGLGNLEVTKLPLFDYQSERNYSVVAGTLKKSDIWITNRAPDDLLAHFRGKLAIVPLLAFPGFHPDLCSSPLIAKASNIKYHSGILLSCYQAGLSRSQAISFFNHEIYDYLKYTNSSELAFSVLESELAPTFGRDCTDDFLERLMRAGNFMWTNTHPKAEALHAYSSLILRSLQIDHVTHEFLRPSDFLNYFRWANYPDINRGYAEESAYIWLMKDRLISTLAEFVSYYYDLYSEVDPDSLINSEIVSPIGVNFGKFKNELLYK